MDAPAFRTVPRTVILAALAGAVWGCGRPGGETSTSSGFGPRPGAPAVVISIDTLRSDRLPAYGYQGVATPAIDAFRADAVLFERAFAHYPLTLPSHVTIFTGQLPPENGVRDNAGYRLAPDYPTYLPRLLRRSGYATGAFVSSYSIRGATGLAQGFDLYDDAVETEGAGQVWGPERAGDRTLEPALAWLDSVARGPFFLFFHIYEPHLPHTPPEPFRSRYGDTYEAEVAAADAVVGELLEGLKARGLYEDTLILLVSDHGEGLEDHQEKGHGIFLYREALQIPLLMKLPGTPAELRAATVSEPAQLVDVTPTVLDVVGEPIPPGVTGISLLSLLAGGGPDRPAYAETMYPRLHYGWSDLASLIEGRFHYVEAPEPELYDLVADPAERENVLVAERGVYFRMRDRLAEIKRPLEPPLEEDEETKAKLAALGYLAATSGPDGGSLPDPKAALARSLEQMERAFNLFRQQDFDGAVAAFEILLRDNPRMTDAWRQLGMARRELGRPEDALAAFEKAMTLSGGSPQVAAQIGMVMVDLGRLDEARDHAETARGREPVLAAELDIEIALAEGDLDRALDLSQVATGPDAVSPQTRRRIGLELSVRGRHAEAVALLSRLARESDAPPAANALAQALLAAGRPGEAEPLVEGVLRRFPDNATALEYRGLIALGRGQPAAARDALRRSVTSNARQANAWNLLGVALFQLRDVAGALDAWERSVELDPEQWDSLYNLGFTAARAGQREKARRALDRYVATAPPVRFAREIAEARRLLAQLEG